MACKGASVELSGNEKAVYEEIIVENALRLHLEAMTRSSFPIRSHFR